MKGQIIAVVNQKGGTGKTTTCANLGVGLAIEPFPKKRTEKTEKKQSEPFPKKRTEKTEKKQSE